MKKLLVLVASAALVLSTAAVSLAAATVGGDFRYEFIEDESNAGNSSYGTSDLRVKVTGDLSEKVSASGTFQWKHDGKKGEKTADFNEYFITYKEAWGSVKGGFYEYKFTPSRLLIESSGYKVWEKADCLITGSVNLAESLTADLIVQPYAQNAADDGSYGLALNYATDKWGIKATYANFQYDKDLNAFDVYYMPVENLKVFVVGVDYSAAKAKYDGLDPVFGVSLDKIAGTNLFAGAEYALKARNDGKPDEYSEYAVNLKYAFADKTALEFEHTIPDKDKAKDVVRLLYKF